MFVICKTKTVSLTFQSVNIQQISSKIFSEFCYLSICIQWFWLSKHIKQIQQNFYTASYVKIFIYKKLSHFRFSRGFFNLKTRNVLFNLFFILTNLNKRPVFSITSWILIRREMMKNNNYSKNLNITTFKIKKIRVQSLKNM